MGVLPLEFLDGASATSLGLNGEEVFDFPDLNDELKPRSAMRVIATRSGKPLEFLTTVRIDTPVELLYYRNGGILQTVTLNLLKDR